MGAGAFGYILLMLLLDATDANIYICRIWFCGLLMFLLLSLLVFSSLLVACFSFVPSCFYFVLVKLCALVL